MFNNNITSLSKKAEYVFNNNPSNPKSKLIVCLLRCKSKMKMSLIKSSINSKATRATLSPRGDPTTSMRSIN
jgi:hypothetical protein